MVENLGCLSLFELILDRSLKEFLGNHMKKTRYLNESHYLYILFLELLKIA